MKINRRDYLKRMGAAGVFAGATGLDVFAHESADPQQSCPADPTCPKPTAPLIWEPRWCDPLPSNADKCVKLIFEGLTGIAPRRLVRDEEECGLLMKRDKVVCEVGFHSKGGSGIDHQLEISAYSNVVDPSKCPQPKEFKQKKIEKIELCVDDPELDQAYFYQRGPACTRRDLAYDEDFRWIIDFESNYLYRKHLSANSYLGKYDDCYSPILTVRYGIFYTLLKTASTFLARSEDNKYFIDMGNVARIIGANVYVKSGVVKLIVDGVTYTIQPPGEIYFKNHCMKGSSHCQFESENADKKKRSDFFLNYKAFDRKGHSEYQLHLLEGKEPRTPKGICERDRFIPKDEKSRQEMMINDESPCSAAGYGGEYKGLTGSS